MASSDPDACRYAFRPAEANSPAFEETAQTRARGCFSHPGQRAPGQVALEPAPQDALASCLVGRIHLGQFPAEFPHRELCDAVQQGAGFSGLRLPDLPFLQRKQVGGQMLERASGISFQLGDTHDKGAAVKAAHQPGR